MSFSESGSYIKKVLKKQGSLVSFFNVYTWKLLLKWLIPVASLAMSDV